jgi:hypothetical protein
VTGGPRATLNNGVDRDRFMTHLAIWEAPADGGQETEWGELVTDDEYGAIAGDVSR